MTAGGMIVTPNDLTERAPGFSRGFSPVIPCQTAGQTSTVTRSTTGRRNEPGTERTGRPSVRVTLHALIGFAFGYVILHPVSMLIFRWLDMQPGGMQAPKGAIHGWLDPIFHSFRPDMLPMAIVFGIFGSAIAVLDGIHRSALARRRDELAYELSINERTRARLKELVGTLRERNGRLRRLERANRRSTQFMVHDLKNNLHCIIGFAELMLSRKGNRLSPDDVDALIRIGRQGNQMKNAVMDLLEMARLQEKPELQRQRIDTADLLRKSLEDLQIPMDVSRVELGDKHRECPETYGDPRLIIRVLVNLAVNAVKHNSPGILVTLDAEPDPGSGGVLFTCRDDGKGIVPDILQTLFDKFVRDNEKPTADSTGLGLAFCQAAVAAHGGRIRAENESGSGACFRFSIPGPASGPPGAD
jgi:signal transduction histidine kinase